MLSKLETVVPAAAASLGGIGLYLLGDDGKLLLAIVIAFVVWVIGYVCLTSGRKAMAAKPVLGVVAMTGWMLGLVAIGAAITASLIVLGIAIADELSSLSEDQAKTVGGVATAALTLVATTFFTDDLEKGTGDMWPGAKTKAAMSSAFANCFAANSVPYRAVYEDRLVAGGEDIKGWGLRARLRRAKIVAAAL